MTRTKKFRPVLAGTEVSRITEALNAMADRAVQGSAARVITRQLARRLAIEWADWMASKETSP